MRNLLITALLLSGHLAFSGEVNNLIQFKPNTTAKSSEVNQNFNTIKDAVNDNNSRIGMLEQFKNDMESPKIRAVTYHASCFTAVLKPSASVPRTFTGYQYLQDEDNTDDWNNTYCPITLPEGSKILKIVARVYDFTADAAYIVVGLYRSESTASTEVGSTAQSSNAGYENLEIDLTGSPEIIEGGPDVSYVLYANYSSDQKGMNLGLKAVTVYYEYDPTYSSTLP